MASIVVLRSLDCVARWRKRANPQSASSIRQQFRYVSPAFYAAMPILENSMVLDTRTYLCVCPTLRSPSSCSSWSSPSGDHRSRGTGLLPRTYTRCHRKVRFGISWTTASSTGRGWFATCWGECPLGLGYVVRRCRIHGL